MDTYGDYGHELAHGIVGADTDNGGASIVGANAGAGANIGGAGADIVGVDADYGNEHTEPKRRKHAAAEKWKTSVLKKKRLKGETFKNGKGQDIAAREMGATCKSEHCRKSTVRHCQSLSEEQRQGIFKMFWSMTSWEERQLYIRTLVDKVDIKQKKCQTSRRSASFLYHLQLSDGTSVEVCKRFFCDTVGLSLRTVGSWLKDIDETPPPKPKSPKTGAGADNAGADNAGADDDNAGADIGGAGADNGGVDVDIGGAGADIGGVGADIVGVDVDIGGVDANNGNERTEPKRRKHAASDKWNTSVLKEKRRKGETFKNCKGQDIAARKIGATCRSEHCRKSTVRNCQSLSEEQRQGIFKMFWSMTSWEERQLYIRTLVDKVDIKQKKCQTSRRSASFLYHLQLSDGTSVEVCKRFFCDTVGLSLRTVGSWLKDIDGTSPPKPKSPKTGKTAPFEMADLTFLKDWLNNLPTLPSHYCRQVPTYKNKKILYPGTSKVNLHESYKKNAAEAGARAVGYKLFSVVFDDENLSVFIPRKDQCDTCVKAKHGNVDQAMHDAHIEAKDQARAEKTKDTEAANDKLSVWTMDLQAVLLCPQIKASAMYYKTKLIVHNFTLYNLRTKDGFCYAWDETEGDLGEEVFAHLQFKHFDMFLEANRSIEKMIIWSDGCGYQNRNATVSNAYMHLAIKHGVEIIQKYLVPGHTQMECDSIHSAIERKRVCDIFTPRDYFVIFESARLRPSPYHVSQVYHNDIMKLSGNYVTSIRPGNSAGDPTVNDLRALKYISWGLIQYKVKFSEETEWEALPQMISMPNRPFEWVRLFPTTLPISLKAFKDLQSMKPVMPQRVHHFFDSLPHLEH